MIKNIILILLVPICLSCALISPAENEPNHPQGGSQEVNPIGYWDFEGESPLHDLTEEKRNDKDIEVVADPLNPKNNVLKCFLPVGADRSEVSWGKPRIHPFFADSADENNGSEFWISARVLILPKNIDTKLKPCIFQIGPVSNPVKFAGVTSKGFYQIRINGSSQQWNSRLFGSPYTPADLDQNMVKVKNGQWEKFVIHCKYSSNDDGLLEVWKDGAKVLTQEGANAVPGNRVRIKWGVYIGIGNTAENDLTCYYDDVKVNGRHASYNIMSQN